MTDRSAARETTWPWRWRSWRRGGRERRRGRGAAGQGRHRVGPRHGTCPRWRGLVGATIGVALVTRRPWSPRMRAAAAGPGRSAVLVGRSLHRPGERDVAASIGPGQGPHRRAAERGGAVAAAARGGAGARRSRSALKARARSTRRATACTSCRPRGAAARQRGQVPRHRRFRRPDDLVDPPGRLSRLLQPSLVRIHRRAEGSTDGEPGPGCSIPSIRTAHGRAGVKAWETGQPYEIEYRLRHRSGEYRWVGLGAPSRSAMRRGRITRWYGSCTTSTASRWSRNSFS